MTVKIHTKIEKQGLAEHDPSASMEYGYGQYVNAYVTDTELEVPEAGVSGDMGIWATERVPFDADKARISRARRRARARARDRYVNQTRRI